MQNEVSIKILHYEEIDTEEFCKLQRTVFSPLIKEAGGDDSYITPLFFKWKYNTPSGRGFIAFVEKNGKIIGSNSMIPFNLMINGKLQKSWQSCDTAVLPGERGKGYFSKCIAQLKTKIKEGEYFWGFPNANSINGFSKLGWVKNSSITLWVKPLFFFDNNKIRNEREILKSEKLLFPGLNCDTPVVYLQKTIEYFKWRYLNHPCHKYFMQKVAMDENNYGIIVFREVNIKGKKILLLMDYIGCYKALRKNFSKTIIHFAKENNIHYISYWGTALTFIQLLRLGFLPIPNFLLPKKHILCSEVIGKSKEENKRKWIIQTGDYDLF